MKTNDKHNAPDELFAGLVPPTPPKELKEGVVAAAQSVWQGERRTDVWARLWFHRGLRAAWAGTVAVLLFGHLLVSSELSTHEAVVVDTRPDVAIADFLRPTRILATATPNVGRFGPDASDISTFSLGGNG